MRKKTPILPTLLMFGTALAGAAFAASYAVSEIEERSAVAVDAALAREGLDWADAGSDGLRLSLTGTAPDEAARFRAISVAGQIVDAGRVSDMMEVKTSTPIAAPDFSIEILRAADEITLIGLVPVETDRQALLARVGRSAFETPVVDLLETANFAAPDGWSRAVEYGLSALGELEQAKISIAVSAVSVTTIAESDPERDRLARRLESAAPDGVEVALNVTAPRPVVSPFILRLVKTPEAVRFDACTAGNEAGARRILAAAEGVGLPEEQSCRLGLGVPSADWADTATRAIAALGDLGTGTLTLSDLSVTLEAGEGQEADAFETVTAALQTDLPEEFTLTAILPDNSDLDPELAPAEFAVTRAPEGLVQMRGRLPTERSREVTVAFARSLFGVDQVRSAIDVEPQVPEGWGPRVMSALDALSMLSRGSVTVTEDNVAISGASGAQDADDEVARILSAQLGDAARYEIDIAYDKRADPTLALPTPQECVDQVNAILTERQITFDPGSADIDAASRDSVDAIAEIVRKCEGVRMEVGGYTDSQGREIMNQQLSQQRAEALMTALQARRVLISDLDAVGYGEADPIADNDTEAGREANRRIQFRLLETDTASGPDRTDDARAAASQ